MSPLLVALSETKSWLCDCPLLVFRYTSHLPASFLGRPNIQVIHFSLLEDSALCEIKQLDITQFN